MLTAEEYKQAEFGYSLDEARRGFKIHAAVYGVVMSGLIVLNVLLIVFTDANFPWAAFPLVGWGIGLAFHYGYAFRGAGVAVHRRQQTIEEFAERTKQTTQV
jgi:2TM domain